MRRVEHPQVEMQIAPLIDVCFLLLFFYILTSKPDRPEAELRSSLPGSVVQEQPFDIPDEQRVEILESGIITLNEEPVGVGGERELPQLRHILTRYKQSASHNHTSALLTISPADGARHQRIVDVLNACAEAGITEVSFSGIESAGP